MAVLSGLPDIEVGVCVSDIVAKEYLDDDVEAEDGDLTQYQASKTVTKYIESMSDEEFSVELSVKPTFNFDCEALGFEVYINSRKVKSPILKNQSFDIAGGWKTSIDGGKNVDEASRFTIRNFKFDNVDTTIDEDKVYSVKDDTARIGEVGEITVWVYRKTDVRGTDNHGGFGMMYDDAIHGKAFTGQSKSHDVVLGETQASKPGHKFTSKKMDGEGRPIAIFRFKYCSRATLQFLRIVPPTPDMERPSAPTPSRGARRYTLFSPNPKALDLDATSPDEKAELAEYFLALRGNTIPLEPRVKREREQKGGSVGGARKKVRQEGPQDVEMIDYTGDN